MDFKPTDMARLKQFKLDRVLSEEPLMLNLLGSFPTSEGGSDRAPAILRMERLPLDAKAAASPDFLEDVKLLESTDIYSWFIGWIRSASDTPHIKVNIVFPASDVHIRKYTAQKTTMVHETPALYQQIVKPYIDSFPPSRTQWVESILSGKSEVDKVLFNDKSADTGFVLLPDMKWDLKTLSTLYLVAITRSRALRSLRDLRKTHLNLLRRIRHEASSIVQDKWGLSAGGMRMYVHYQPSYYHFHVHIVNANQSGLMGMAVGQAHLLDDVISLLELDLDDGPGVFERMTLTYGLGDQHGLYAPLMAVSASALEDI